LVASTALSCQNTTTFTIYEVYNSLCAAGAYVGAGLAEKVPWPYHESSIIEASHQGSHGFFETRVAKARSSGKALELPIHCQNQQCSFRLDMGGTVPMLLNSSSLIPLQWPAQHTNFQTTSWFISTAM